MGNAESDGESSRISYRPEELRRTGTSSPPNMKRAASCRVDLAGQTTIIRSEISWPIDCVTQTPLY